MQLLNITSVEILRSATKAILSTLYIGFLLSVKVSAAPAHPNFLFVLVDDQRNDTLGCAGHPVIQTPNINRLASQGVLFQNAFVTTSICMSSRASIFTGLTETGHGYTGGGPPATPVIEQDVDTSFPVLLKKEGYRTGFFGKQHVKFEEGDNAALSRMFDKYELIDRSPYFKEQPDGSLRHEADLIGDRSLEFLAAQSKENPFCLYMSFNTAHAEDSDRRPGIGHYPWPHSVDGMYEDIDPASPRLGEARYFEVQPEFLKNSFNRERWFWRWDTAEKYAINMRAYYRMLTGMDKVVGRMQRQLEELGLAENTVIIYTADNGYYMGDRGFAGKWSHYEESLRVPLIVYDPRLPQQQRGRLVEPMALNIDLPPSMLELAGVKIPEKYQGRSLVSILRGETSPDWRTDFFCEFHYNHDQLPNWRGVRGNRFTYACYYEQSRPYEFLFDLESDPTQFNNLTSRPEYQNTLIKMRERSEFYLKEYTRPEIVATKRKLAESIQHAN